MNKVASWFCKIFLAPLVGRFFIKEVRGIKNLPKGSFILASNHLSYLDIPMNAYLCLPRAFNFIGQIDGFKGVLKWLVSFVYFLSGVIPLDRKNKKSKEKTIKRAVSALKRGRILIIYPEGGRSKDGKLKSGKLGIAKIFLKTGVPIVPVALKGTFELMPPGGKFKIKKIVSINIGKALMLQKEFQKAQELNEDSEEHHNLLRGVTDRVMSEIASLL